MKHKYLNRYSDIYRIYKFFMMKDSLELRIHIKVLLKK